MFTNVHKRSQTFTNVHKRSQTFTNVHKRSQTFTNVHKRSQTFTNLRNLKTFHDSYLHITEEKVDKVVELVSPRHHAHDSEYELSELALVDPVVLVKFYLLLDLFLRCGTKPKYVIHGVIVSHISLNSDKVHATRTVVHINKILQNCHFEN